MKTVPMIAAAAVALGGAGWYLSTTSTGEPGLTSLAVEAQEASEVDKSIVEEMSIGNPDAEVTVIEYASFTCPHCRNFHENVLPELKANYVDNDKINFIYREVYFDRYGLWAGIVARCAGREKYFGIADLLYEQQAEWTSGEPAEIAQKLRRIGKTAGLDDAQLETCLSDGDKARAMVAVFEQNAEADGIDSTPSFIINGEKHGNLGVSEFSAAIDEELGE